MVDIPLNSQKAPAEYLLRKFLINYNIQGFAKITGPNHLGSGKVPVLTSDSALAYAAFVLAKLRLGILVSDVNGSGDWSSYIDDALTQADAALAAVSASQWGFFPTPQRMLARLQASAARTGTPIPAPAALAADWATHPDNAPVAADVAVTIAHGAAINIDLLQGVTDADLGDVITVYEVNGKYPADLQEIDVELADGSTLPLVYHSATHSVTGTAPAGGQTIEFPVVVTDGHMRVQRNVVLTITGPVVAVAPASGALPNATHGVNYNEQITGSGGTAPYAYALLDNDVLPAGINLSATGLLSGAPDQGGYGDFHVVVTDANGVDTTVHYTLQIA